MDNRKEVGGWGLRHASFHSVMPVKGGGGSGSPGWPSTSARHLESGLVIRRFAFIHNDPKRRRKRKPLAPRGGLKSREGIKKPKANQLCGKPASFLPSRPPEQLKTRQ